MYGTVVAWILAADAVKKDGLMILSCTRERDLFLV